jgi:hypothetical protein
MNQNKSYGLLFILINLRINPDMAIAQKKLYPKELIPKEQGFNKDTEIIIDRTETVTTGAIGTGFG